MRPRSALMAGCATVAGVCACAIVVTAAPPAERPLAIKQVCFEGREVTFAGAPAGLLTRWFRFGPWEYGARASQTKPSDKDPNLYIVVPGSQHHADEAPQFDNTAVLSGLGGESETRFDVYWAIVLDPELKNDLRTERDLLLEAQKEFTPPDDYAFEAIPGRAALARVHIDSVDELARFRHKDGKLPRLVILPAGLAVRATVTDSAAEAAGAPQK